MAKSTNVKSVLDYIGSKVKLAPVIIEEIEDNIGPLNGTMCDIFAGTGAVSRWVLNNRVIDTIVTNDFEIYSNAVCVATMRPISIEADFYDYLNNLKGTPGFITEHCSPNGEAGRRFFTAQNATKIDHIKDEILHLFDNGKITIDKAIKLMGELTIAADKVSNTASVYGAFLKKFKASALKEVMIKPLEPQFKTPTQVWNLREDANYAASILSGDILYIDPPYNSRQYGNNYHVLNYIADLSAEFKYKPTGITGVYQGWKRSAFCNKKRVAAQLDRLISDADFEHIVLSYNNRGILPLITLRHILGKHGEILNIKSILYKNFKADRSRTYDSDVTTEYIITLRKSEKPV